MSAVAPTADSSELDALLRGRVGPIVAWLDRWDVRRLALHLAIIVAGAGAYGAAIGWWRAPLQALYAGLKLPLILLCTTFGNAIFNALLAPLLGLNLSFRQSLLSILMSYSVAAMVLGSFAPVAAFMVWNLPPASPQAQLGASTYSAMKFGHVCVIAFAGVAANLRLFQLLVNLGGNVAVARRVLFAWLAGNLFLGSQVSWILRPFIGSPLLPVEFLRPDAFHGNFYENAFRALQDILSR